ncbi:MULTISPECIES: phage terminase small subunit P27 family [unclassified Mesorhizobium]|uniref:phage terminase small subunit P27 family n=1 Tax=unclassified Mesorhizobium TaxID=325217 RepID=UPI00112D670A|nr:MULTISPECIES: phage terminase small subunit P27 family [unclassified Mesorhizobium]MBZ9999633.1 phage terminase small subunit P27 family [Mesorhizobium sp. B264B2A]MCA0008107.1 phage terminase small subunit P27 family [Mesorhizobium sp. B264B1B]MCA0018019.1 phage terminase small subunit P27 family [Mesorhizobium sp. B264B1A]TPJ36033.1 phage terminase small subunit P27 family [Mesorhizobium sp. B2-6-6]
MARGRKAEITAVDGALSVPPRCPSWMPKHAKAEWQRIVPQLVADRKLAAHEVQSVESYCLSVARIRESETIIQRDGITYIGPDGQPKRHPATAILKEHQEAARRLLIELGGTPASRGKNKGGARGERGEDEDLGDI